MLVKSKIPFLIVVFWLPALLLTACDSPMGMGQTIDLEPPSIEVTSVVLPDGTEIPLQEEDNKLFIGPGILVGPGFYLKGVAWDNELVTEIIVEETGSNAEIVNGKPRAWTNAVIGVKKPELNGGQEWTISLDGISRGERNIQVTACDFPRNIGPDTVKQLTLLVDTSPPFIEKIYIERQPGITVNLLPKIKLEEMDDTLFENIDYFQNEFFTIRASIFHDFSLSSVTLNLVNEEGNNIFTSDLTPSGGSMYAPYWTITAEQIVNSNSFYASGKHYFNVSITARAAAGHSNEDIVNLLYNLCWYPQADFPKHKIMLPESQIIGETLITEKGGVIPIRVYDDDNVGEVYAAVVSLAEWDGYLPGTPDEDKLKSFYLPENRTFAAALGINLITSETRSLTVSADSGSVRGSYRLIIIIRDKKISGDGVWSSAVYPVNVTEEGSPLITISDPKENSSPYLDDGSKFTLKGKILNLDDVRFLKIAWTPVGGFPDAASQMTNAEDALKAHSGSNNQILPNGIKIWYINIIPEADRLIGSRYFKEYSFEKTFDIFTDFTYDGEVENRQKFLLIYSRGDAENTETFQPHRLDYYKTAPSIEIVSPGDVNLVNKNDTINFNIKVAADHGIRVKSTTLVLNNVNIPLTRGVGAEINTWTGVHSISNIGKYTYMITAVDEMDNIIDKSCEITVQEEPTLTSITTSHLDNTVFSENEVITIQAGFSSIVHVDKTPSLRLGGFVTGGGERLANYSAGSGSKTLIFKYTVSTGEQTSGALTVTGFDYAGDAKIHGVIPANLNTIVTPYTKTLRVNAILPVFTGITVTGNPVKPSGWYKADEELLIRVAANKEIRVLGNPKLIMEFNGVQKQADFQKMEKTTNDNDTMVFSYFVKTGDNTGNDEIYIRKTNCFSEDHRKLITDTIGAGNSLSLTNVGSFTSVGVDTTPPASLSVTTHTSNTGNSKRYQISNQGVIETYPNTVLQYTINGMTWDPLPSGASLIPPSGPLTAEGSYTFAARQIDRAGNEGGFVSVHDNIGGGFDLAAVVCDNPDGAYGSGALNFRLIFTDRVYTTGTVSITIRGGSTGDTGNTNVTLTGNIAKNESTNGYFIPLSWNIPANARMYPVEIVSVNIAGVRRTSDDKTPDNIPANISGLISTFNTTRTGLKVLRRAPTITQINGNAAIDNGTTVITPASGTSVLRLTFSQPVYAEKGFITVRPAENWILPPAIGNDDFSRIQNSLTGGDKDRLTASGNTSYYIKNTQGLKVSGTNYVPDTDTKYVLNFTGNLQDAQLIPLFERAKYQWQEIEVVSQDQVKGLGTANIEVHLEQLADGRRWMIEIDENAFFDEAGNLFAGWKPAAPGGYTTHIFWSQKTATPVIRVERVSNNRAHAGITGALATLQTNVRYRIDCETPGAAITFGTWNRGDGLTQTSPINDLRGIGKGVARITTGAMPNQGTGDPYIANSNDGNQNSAIADMTTTEVAALNTSATTNYTNGWYILAGTTTRTTNTADLYVAADLYTARKDYVCARATHAGPNLTASDNGYEGIFKTLIIYRAVNGNVGVNDFMKTEATDTQNGPVKIAGFPMTYNDRSGKTNKYVYRNGANNTADWIFITWEIVSDFWHVGMTVNTDVPDSRFENDAWQAFQPDWYNHNFRKYGNWGLRVGVR
jgi:hypothetical protein